MVAGKPWLKFYPTDWRADQALRMCSLASRGLWIELMCIMHEANPYGHLVVNGMPVSDTQIATLTGTGPDQVAELLAELEGAGVFSRNRARVIYSRRMVRDEKRARIARKTGQMGGNPKLGKQTEKQTSDKGGVKGHDKTQRPEARGQTQESPPCAPSERSPPAGGKRRATRLPDDWWPSEADVAYAQRQGIPAERIQRVAEDFRDYWHTKAGQGATKTDWSRTWQKWTRTEAERLPSKQRPDGYGRHQPENYLDSALRDVCGAFDAQSGDRSSPGELYEDDDGGEGDAAGLPTGGGELLPPRRRQGGG